MKKAILLSFLIMFSYSKESEAQISKIFTQCIDAIVAVCTRTPKNLTYLRGGSELSNKAVSAVNEVGLLAFKQSLSRVMAPAKSLYNIGKVVIEEGAVLKFTGTFPVSSLDDAYRAQVEIWNMLSQYIKYDGKYLIQTTHVSGNTFNVTMRLNETAVNFIKIY